MYCRGYGPDSRDAYCACPFADREPGLGSNGHPFLRHGPGGRRPGRWPEQVGADNPGVYCTVEEMGKRGRETDTASCGFIEAG